MTDLDVTGVFWLPDAPEEGVAGRLTFSRDSGGELDLIGAFGGVAALLQFQSAFAGPAPTRILGLADRREITLDGVVVTNMALQAPGGVRQTFYVGQVLLGGHFDASEPLAFRSAAVSLEGLPYWVGRAGVDLTMEESADTASISMIDLAFRPPAREERPIPGGTLEMGFTWSLSGDHVTTSRLDQGCYLRIRRD